MKVLRWYQKPGLSAVGHERAFGKVQSAVGKDFNVVNLESELCFYVQLAADKEGLLRG